MDGPTMTNNTDHLRMCRACMVSDESLTSLKMSGLEDIFTLLLGSTLTGSPTTHWLCDKCIHTMQKISTFRDLCIKTEGVLRQYYISYSEGNKEGIEFLQSQRKMLHAFDTGQDYSNTKNVDLKPHIKEESMDEPLLTNSNSPIPANYSPEDNLETSAHDEEDINIFPSKTNKSNTNNSPFQLSINFKRVKSVKFDMINEMFNSDNFEHWKAANLKHLVGKGDPDKNMMIKEILNTEEEIAEDRLIKERNPKYVQSSFKCQSCVYGFNLAFRLENHMKIHEPGRGGEKCNLCDQYFSNVQSLRRHIFWNHRLRIRCAICGHRVRSNKNAMYHARIHKGEKYSCQICQKELSTLYSLETHISRLHKTKIECGVCNECFISNKSLQKHLEVTHTRSKELICNVCEKVLNTQDQLLEHFENHRSTKNHYCVECDKYFTNYCYLQIHLTKTKKHGDIAMLKFSCDKCPKKYPKARDLKQHIESAHEGKRNFNCLECKSSYASAGALRAHVRTIHKGYKPPKKHCCHICNKTFSSKSELKSHLVVHTGDRPFACSQCEWRFSQKSALRTHIKLVHLKVKQNVKSKPCQKDVPS